MLLTKHKRINYYYDDDVTSYLGYYPFGSLMPGRNASSGDYRYGFNGHEKIDEIDGVTGSKLDFGARIYDSRLGRFLSVDPRAPEFPFMSPYCFAANTPIMAIDEDGEGPVIIVYSAYNTKRIKAALAKGNFKKVLRILKRSMTHGWVNKDGKVNTYEAKQMRAKGISGVPLNTSAKSVDSKTVYTFIYGYEKDADGNYQHVKLYQVADEPEESSVFDDQNGDGNPEYIEPGDAGRKNGGKIDDFLEGIGSIFGGISTIEKQEKINPEGTVSFDDLKHGDTVRMSHHDPMGSPWDGLVTKDKGGKMEHVSPPGDKKVSDYKGKLKQ